MQDIYFFEPCLLMLGSNNTSAECYRFNKDLNHWSAVVDLCRLDYQETYIKAQTHHNAFKLISTYILLFCAYNKV